MRVDVKPIGSDAVATHEASLNVNVLCKLDVRDLKIETFAAASTAAGGAKDQTATATFPGLSPTALTLGAKQTLRVTFAVRDKAQPKRAVGVAQAMVRLAHAETGRDFVFVAKSVDAAAGSYAAELYLDAKSVEALGRQSGVWRLELLLGDSFVEQAVQWHVADATLSFKGAPLPTPFAAHQSLPTIAHKFREPSRRPPRIVSLVFAALVLAPLVALLLVALPRLGVNLGAAPSNLVAAVAFHALLGAVLVLYSLYFFKLNMLQTLTYLAALGLPLLLVGRSLLSSVQARRLAATPQQ